eukprot:CAMPEP_0175778708 /NCGR_PEP_ID=MMETSP0097-20121207/75837_1 /TAXON_ID=311494 /ORGANISM="Alexandrium monilatum, Strain CCMP3105" /LENGTH=97 /DNA_ID=CAMNT_0017089367 /DNA_START=290 /DNA_END=580 /DNA_ORIENTATION=-
MQRQLHAHATQTTEASAKDSAGPEKESRGSGGGEHRRHTQVAHPPCTDAQPPTPWMLELSLARVVDFRLPDHPNFLKAGACTMHGSTQNVTRPLSLR